MMMSEASTCVVVGASGGLGSSVAARLVGRGCQVVGVDRDEAVVSSTDYRHYVLDFALSDAPKHLLANLGNTSVTHVLNFSGGALPIEVESDQPLELPLRWFDETMRDNVITSINAIRLMSAHTHAPSLDRSITLCSSLNAMGNYGYPFYSMSKAALESLVCNYCHRLGRSGIRLNALRLGTVLTGTSRQLHGREDSAHYSRLRRMSALGRFVTAEDVADAAASVALDLHGVTGQILTVDGGQGISGSSS